MSEPGLSIQIHNSLDEIDAAQWNALLHSGNPFMRHEFLFGLESSGCVSEASGWQPHHYAVYNSKDKLIFAMPCYAKNHSYGEYIFDWAWADAYHRNGLAYYPKLINTVPFTPATGERLLFSIEVDAAAISQMVFEHIKRAIDRGHFSSFHSLFLAEPQAPHFKHNELSIRHSQQFHWHNQGYTCFDDFLAALNAKKRKNIKRERRKVDSSGISYRWLTGDELDGTTMKTMYGFYQRTTRRYGAQAYLNAPFFDYLAEHFNGQTLVLMAYYQQRPIAGSLYFKSNDTLYGRYWGCEQDYDSLHFETCYYQAIDWCIQHRYAHFEAGAQGEHKLARGLTSTTTYSAHWLGHAAFRNAIDDYIEQEKQHLIRYSDSLKAHSPFRKESRNKGSRQK